VIALVGLIVLAQTATPDSASAYVAAAIGVAFITAVPSTIAALGVRSTKREIEIVRREVTPTTDGSSSFDLLHRLVWETHETTNKVVDRVAVLEGHPCPYAPKEPR
jgi:hypothetical protein